MNWWRTHKQPSTPGPHDEVDPLILGDMIDEAMDHIELMSAISEAF